jgi:uncharacterized phage-associated protein
MPYSAKSIANAFISLAGRQGTAVSNMKLQKLLYFAHAMYLAMKGEALISERPEAWQYGPVFPSVYHEFKSFGSAPITCFATEANFEGDSFQCLPAALPQEPQVLSFLQSIWNTYGNQTAVSLSALSHAPGGPWERVRHEAPGSMGADIPDAYIKEYYQRALAAQRPQPSMA